MSVPGGAGFAAIARGDIGARVFAVFAVFLAALFEMFACPGDGETFFVEQALDFENGFDVFAAIGRWPLGLFTGCSMGNSVSQ
jgi:hypothetical protein